MTTQQSIAQYDLIIIGAGIAGLCTGLFFLDEFPQHSILIIEARDRVGGRTYAEDVQGYRWDLGGQWLGNKQYRMYQLCERFGLQVFEQYYKGKVISVPYSNNEPIEIFDNSAGDDCAHNLDSNSDRFSSVYPSYVNQYIKDIEVCLKEIQESEEKRREYDSLSVFEWKEKMYGSEIANKLNTVQGLVATDPKNVSFLYWLYYVLYGQGLVFLSETHGGGQHDRVKGGAFSFSIKIFEELAQKKNCHFLFSSPVQHIDQQSLDHLNLVKVITKNGKIAASSKVVLAIPPILIPEINFQPQLPRNKQLLYDNFPMGNVIKALIFYNKPWWRENNYSGISLTNNSIYGVRLSYDASLEFKDLKQFALVAFFLGNGAKDWQDKTKEERLRHCCECFGYFFNNIAAASRANVIDYIEKNWNKERYSGGAYAGYLPPNILTRSGGIHSIRENVGRVHFAGSETATYFLGYGNVLPCTANWIHLTKLPFF
jgi:monoamine oxidase